MPSYLPEPASELPDGERFEQAVANETAQAEGVVYGLNNCARPAAAAPAEAPRKRSFVKRALAERADRRDGSREY